jgi:hypothetical protein
MSLKASWRLRLCFIFVLLELVWAFSALSVGRGANQASTVQMSGVLVWIFLHLPAALLGSWPFGNTDGALPAAELWLMGAFGVLQSAGLGWWLGWRMDRKREGN